MQKKIKINGVDISSYVTKAGYSVSYKKIHGGAGGVTLDGGTTEDILAVKAVITVPILPMLGDASAHMLTDLLYEYNYPEVYYYDPLKNTYREVQTLFDNAFIQHVGENINYDEVWKALSLIFTER